MFCLPPFQLPLRRPKELKRVSRTRKRINRVYGGHICAKCLRDRLVRGRTHSCATLYFHLCNSLHTYKVSFALSHIHAHCSHTLLCITHTHYHTLTLIHTAYNVYLQHLSPSPAPPPHRILRAFLTEEHKMVKKAFQAAKATK